MASSSNVPTIIDLKSSFLRAQILALSQPFRPSVDFLDSNSSDEETAIRQKSIDDALHKLNGLLKKHNKLAYGPQAQRHVAEQVDQLYWNAGEKGVHTLGVGEEWAEKGTDYRKSNVIEQLPEEWSAEAESKAPELARRYEELQRRLVQLNVERTVAREKVENYKEFKKLLEPFGKDGNIQSNLVTKNGEVEEELEKMRRLMLRVERGLGALDESNTGDEMDVDLENDGGNRILALLSRS